MNENEMPIFRTRDVFGNMKKDRFVVPQPTTLVICNQYVLKKDSQTTTVNKLVDRTPNWLKMEKEDQLEAIKAALVLQTVAEYLKAKNMIQDSCTMFENGFDKDGNVVLDAFYVKENKVKAGWEKEFKNKQVQTNDEKTEQLATIYPFKK